MKVDGENGSLTASIHCPAGDAIGPHPVKRQRLAKKLVELNVEPLLKSYFLLGLILSINYSDIIVLFSVFNLLVGGSLEVVYCPCVILSKSRLRYLRSAETSFARNDYVSTLKDPQSTRLRLRLRLRLPDCLLLLARQIRKDRTYLRSYTRLMR